MDQIYSLSMDQPFLPPIEKPDGLMKLVYGLARDGSVKC